MTLATEKNKVSSTGSWVFLFELGSDTSTAVRVCMYDAQITFEGVTWYPYPIEVRSLTTSSDGTIGQIEVSVSNVARLLTTLLDEGKIVDQPARVILTHTAALTESVQYTYVILSATANERVVVLRLGTRNPLQESFPGEYAYRGRCRFAPEYGDPLGRCGYDRRPAAALQSCDYTLDGDNGCIVHGDDELARGLPRLHPRRFGGFPGIPKGPITG